MQTYLHHHGDLKGSKAQGCGRGWFCFCGRGIKRNREKSRNAERVNVITRPLFEKIKKQKKTKKSVKGTVPQRSETLRGDAPRTSRGGTMGPRGALQGDKL